MVLETRRGFIRLGLVVYDRPKYSPADSLTDGDEDETVVDNRTLFFFFMGTDTCASLPILSPLRALVIAKTLFAPVSRPMWLWWWWARPLLLLLLLTGIWFANSGKR